MRYILAIVASIVILMVFAIIKPIYSTIISNYQEAHIHELSEGIYVTLGVASKIIPIIILIILIKIVWKKITQTASTNSKILPINKEDNSPSMDSGNDNKIYEQISPREEANKVKVTTAESTVSNTANEQISDADDELYEQALLEIEEDKKVKATWARALSQSDGNLSKAKALYIQLRVNNTKEGVRSLELDRKEQNKFFIMKGYKEPLNPLIAFILFAFVVFFFLHITG